MRTVRLALFCGSVGQRSSNRALLDVVGAFVANSGWDVASVEGLSAISMFDPALVDAATPVAVESARKSFETADAVAFAVPEYGGGAAGWAKNALDWMVGSGSLYGRVTAVLSAGTTGGPNAIAQIARTLTWQGADVVAALGVMSPSSKSDADGRIVDESTLKALADVAHRLLKSTTDRSKRDVWTTETLDRLSIPRHDRRPN